MRRVGEPVGGPRDSRRHGLQEVITARQRNPREPEGADVGVAAVVQGDGVAAMKRVDLGTQVYKSFIKSKKGKQTKEFFFRKKFTFVPLRKDRLCPSIHFESRPATLVMADTVF